MALKLTLPPDVQERLSGLGDAIAACSPDIQFAYLFGSAAAGALTPRSDIDVAIHVRPGADGHAVRLAVARVERTLHLAIEACMDVADHLVADRRLRVPETGAETFEILGEAGLLPGPLASALASMVGFRNILVHDYVRLDPAIVVRVLESDLSDLERSSRPCSRWSDRVA